MDVLTAALIGAAVGGVYGAVAYAVKSKKKKKFVNSIKEREQSATIPTNVELKGIDLKKLVGQKGVAITDIKPFGKVRIGTEVFEVKTNGAFISSQKTVVVVKVGANNIIFVDLKGE